MDDRKRKELREKVSFLREEFRRAMPQATVGTYKRPARSAVPVQEFTYAVRGSKINGKISGEDPEVHPQEIEGHGIRRQDGGKLGTDKTDNKGL
jgi:hypothetical protein